MCSAKRPKTPVPAAPLQAPRVALGGQRDDKMSAAETTQVRGERREVATNRLHESANAQRENIDARNTAAWWAARKQWRRKHSSNPFKGGFKNAGKSTDNLIKGNTIGKFFNDAGPSLLVKHASAGPGNGQDANLAAINRTRDFDRKNKNNISTRFGIKGNTSSTRMS